jgi:hypothetical protein
MMTNEIAGALPQEALFQEALPQQALPGRAFWVRATRLVLARPGLWWTAVRQALRLARPRWWARAPFVPVPDADYLRFRFETQYGAAGEPDAHDLVTYLEWCRDEENGREAAGHRR